jgi:hypothetical protein
MLQTCIQARCRAKDVAWHSPHSSALHSKPHVPSALGRPCPERDRAGSQQHPAPPPTPPMSPGKKSRTQACFERRGLGSGSVPDTHSGDGTCRMQAAQCGTGHEVADVRQRNRAPLCATPVVRRGSKIGADAAREGRGTHGGKSHTPTSRRRSGDRVAWRLLGVSGLASCSCSCRGPWD